MTDARARVTVNRRFWPPGDLFRLYYLYVDGTLVGSVRRGRSVYYDLAPGRHAVQLKIDWCESPEVDVDLAPGEVANLVCSARIWGKGPPVGSVARRYIALELASVTPAAAAS